VISPIFVRRNGLPARRSPSAAGSSFRLILSGFSSAEGAFYDQTDFRSSQTERADCRGSRRLPQSISVRGGLQLAALFFSGRPLGVLVLQRHVLLPSPTEFINAPRPTPKGR
jgi:hypothetical protein